MPLTRFKALAAAVTTTAAIAGVALGGIAFASTTRATRGAGPAPARTSTAEQAKAQVTPSPSPSPSAAADRHRSVTTLIGHGRVDGLTWSVSLQYDDYLPRGFAADEPPVGGQPDFNGLLCQRMYLGGVQLDGKGGPWADCSPVTGPNQVLGDEGLWGLTGKGTSGDRLFIAQNSGSTAYAVLTFTNGRQYRAVSVRVPGTVFSAFAIPIGKGQYIRTVDTYSARHHLLSHQTEWR